MRPGIHTIIEKMKNKYSPSLTMVLLRYSWGNQDNIHGIIGMFRKD